MYKMERYHLKPERKPKHDKHYVYVHGFIAKFFLKQFGSNRVSCTSTTAKRKKYSAHTVRQVVIQGFGSVFCLQEQKSN